MYFERVLPMYMTRMKTNTDLVISIDDSLY